MPESCRCHEAHGTYTASNDVTRKPPPPHTHTPRRLKSLQIRAADLDKPIDTGCQHTTDAADYPHSANSRQMITCTCYYLTQQVSKRLPHHTVTMLSTHLPGLEGIRVGSVQLIKRTPALHKAT